METAAFPRLQFVAFSFDSLCIDKDPVDNKQLLDEAEHDIMN